MMSGGRKISICGFLLLIVGILTSATGQDRTWVGVAATIGQTGDTWLDNGQNLNWLDETTPPPTPVNWVNGNTFIANFKSTAPNATVKVGSNISLLNLNILQDNGAKDFVFQNSGGSFTVTGTTLNVGNSAGASSTATFSVATSFSTMNVNKGTLSIGTSNVLAGNINIGTAGSIGTLSLGANSDTVGNIVLINGNITGTSGSLTGSSYDFRSGTVSAVLTGSAALTKSTAGTVSLSGANTYTGGTTISGGTLAIGTGGTSGSISGNVLDNAALEVNRSDAITLSGNITGTGSFAQVGTGTTTLTGTNNYAGGTTISGGTLALGASGGGGGTTGSITGDILNNAALQINRSNAISLGGNITGSGTLTQAGAGTTTLSGTNSYSGTTTVQSGTLLVTGSLGNTAVTVNAGAKLRANGTGHTGTVSVDANGNLDGTGSIGSAGVTVNGTVAAGNSIGTLNTGSLTLTSSSTLDYEVNLSAIAADLINVNGDLTISNSTLSLSNLGAIVSLPGSKFTLISYSGTWNNGIFNGFADDSFFSFAGNNWQINYDDTVGGVNGGSFGNFLTITAVPEPSAMLLVGLCLSSLPFLRRRKD